VQLFINLWLGPKGSMAILRNQLQCPPLLKAGARLGNRRVVQHPFYTGLCSSPQVLKAGNRQLNN